MAIWTQLKALVAQVIKANGQQSITGPVLQTELFRIVDSLGALQYKGLASPNTNPGIPDGEVFFFAKTAGTYPYFGNITLAASELACLAFVNGSWRKDSLGTIGGTGGSGTAASPFKGLATVSTSPGSPTTGDYYIATFSGLTDQTFTLFGNIIVPAGQFCILYRTSTAWILMPIGTFNGATMKHSDTPQAGSVSAAIKEVEKLMLRNDMALLEKTLMPASLQTAVLWMHIQLGAKKIIVYVDKKLFGNSSGTFYVISRDSGFLLGSKTFNTAQQNFCEIPIEPLNWNQGSTILNVLKDQPVKNDAVDEYTHHEAPEPDPLDGIAPPAGGGVLPARTPAMDVTLAYKSNNQLVLTQITINYV